MVEQALQDLRQSKMETEGVFIDAQKNYYDAAVAKKSHIELNGLAEAALLAARPYRAALDALLAFLTGSPLYNGNDEMARTESFIHALEGV